MLIKFKYYLKCTFFYINLFMYMCVCMCIRKEYQEITSYDDKKFAIKKNVIKNMR